MNSLERITDTPAKGRAGKYFPRGFCHLGVLWSCWMGRHPFFKRAVFPHTNVLKVCTQFWLDRLLICNPLAEKFKNCKDLTTKSLVSGKIELIPQQTVRNCWGKEIKIHKEFIDSLLSRSEKFFRKTAVSVHTVWQRLVVFNILTLPANFIEQCRTCTATSTKRAAPSSVSSQSDSGLIFPPRQEPMPSLFACSASRTSPQWNHPLNFKDPLPQRIKLAGANPALPFNWFGVFGQLLGPGSRRKPWCDIRHEHSPIRLGRSNIGQFWNDDGRCYSFSQQSWIPLHSNHRKSK